MTWLTKQLSTGEGTTQAIGLHDIQGALKTGHLAAFPHFLPLSKMITLCFFSVIFSPLPPLDYLTPCFMEQIRAINQEFTHLPITKSINLSTPSLFLKRRTRLPGYSSSGLGFVVPVSGLLQIPTLVLPQPPSPSHTVNAALLLGCVYQPKHMLRCLFSKEERPLVPLPRTAPHLPFPTSLQS